MEKMEVFGDFVDSRNNKFQLLRGLREWLKPGWESMLMPRRDMARLVYSIDALVSNLNCVFEVEKKLQRWNCSFVGRNVLEVGCHDGAKTYAMAKFQDTKVTGIDILEYGILQTPDMVIDVENLKAQQSWLDMMRRGIGGVYPPQIKDKVSFSTLDVQELDTTEEYDLIVSWDVLEHIQFPRVAFERMAKALKKGGVMYHEYNSFFSITGGHSLCTLDFPFGHCILDCGDFARYIERIRPKEKLQAINFYTYNLNRMTLAYLKKTIEDAGLKILSLDGHIPYAEDEERGWEASIKKDVLPLVKNIYSDVAFEDLYYDIHFLILAKE